MGEHDIRPGLAALLDCVGEPAALIDGAEDVGVAGLDNGTAAEAVAEDIDEVGVVGEGRGEGGRVARVPGGFELEHDALDGLLVRHGPIVGCHMP